MRGIQSRYVALADVITAVIRRLLIVVAVLILLALVEWL